MSMFTRFNAKTAVLASAGNGTFIPPHAEESTKYFRSLAVYVGLVEVSIQHIVQRLQLEFYMAAFVLMRTVRRSRVRFIPTHERGRTLASFASWLL
jgi:hypothetical protein